MLALATQKRRAEANTEISSIVASLRTTLARLAPAQLYGSQLRTVLELPHGNAQVSLKLPQK